MIQQTHVIAYDLGTTGNKTSLYKIGETLDLVASSIEEYPIIFTEDGGAEQRVDDWWAAICKSTKAVLAETKTDPDKVKGVVFSSQAQGAVFVDKEGTALRNPMGALDGRSYKQVERYLHHGLLRIEKINLFKLLKSLRITGGIAATPKDPLWKYHWVKENEPEVFRKTHKFLDIKDYLVLRCTGQYGMTMDSAQLTFLFDTRSGKEGWHKGLCKMFDVDMNLLPPVIKSTDVVGGLTDQSAREMGLQPGTRVFGGGIDTSLSTIGSGCTGLHDVHIYVGTSGWVSSNVKKRKVDVTNFIASIFNGMPGYFNYVAEQETSGSCLQWVRDHMALEAIDIYLKEQRRDKKDESAKIFDLLNEAVEQTSPGADNLIFTPWLHGNRSPREDAFARGMFFNIKLSTGQRQMVRAVLEGVAYHKRWMLEAIEKTFPRQETIRFVGGGAKSSTWCQIMADVTGHNIETVHNCQDIGTAGGAIVCGVGMGIISSFEKAKALIQVDKIYTPRREYKAIYDKNFEVFKLLYKNNKKLFHKLNK